MSSEFESSLTGNLTRFPTGGEALENLPTNRKEGSQQVATMYFPTDVPAEAGFDQVYTENPEQYLTEHDRSVLRALLGGTVVVENGSITDVKVQQLQNVNWRFLAYADERGSQAHNHRLAKRRAHAVASYMMKLIKQFDQNYRSNWILLPRSHNFEDKWRWQVCANIINGVRFYSGNVGESISQGGDNPYFRAVEIIATSSLPYQDPDAIPHFCAGFFADDNPSYWVWDGKRQVKKPSVSVSDIENRLEGTIEHTYAEQVKGKRALSPNERYLLVRDIRDAVYCYRHQRMVLHGLFLGHWDPSKRVRIFGGNAGPAAADLICNGSTDCKNDLLSQSPFSASSSKGADHNDALQIEHMYLVRTDPFYRAAYLSEFPGLTPVEEGSFTIPFLPGAEIKSSWFLGNATIAPVDQWEFWPTEDWDSLGEAVKSNLADDSVIPSPATEYRTGKQHNRHMKLTGSYSYDWYPFRRTDLDPATSQEWQDRNISQQLKQYNGHYDPTGTSNVGHVRSAVREAQTIVKAKADSLCKQNEPNFYDLYITHWRHKQGQPDYTDPQEWNKWK